MWRDQGWCGAVRVWDLVRAFAVGELPCLLAVGRPEGTVAAEKAAQRDTQNIMFCHVMLCSTAGHTVRHSGRGGGLGRRIVHRAGVRVGVRVRERAMVRVRVGGERQRTT
jgi:hypothetical protein